MPSNKSQGEHAELRFMLQAMQRSLHVLKPWGDNSPYDLVLLDPRSTRFPPRIKRVQVKSTSSLHTCGAYRVHAVFGGKKQAYALRHIDVIAAYVVPFDAWYVVPVRYVLRAPYIYMRPHLEHTKSSWERFRNAWHLLE